MLCNKPPGLNLAALLAIVRAVDLLNLGNYVRRRRMHYSQPYLIKTVRLEGINH